MPDLAFKGFPTLAITHKLQNMETNRLPKMATCWIHIWQHMGNAEFTNIWDKPNFATIGKIMIPNIAKTGKKLVYQNLKAGLSKPKKTVLNLYWLRFQISIGMMVWLMQSSAQTETTGHSTMYYLNTIICDQICKKVSNSLSNCISCTWKSITCIIDLCVWYQPEIWWSPYTPTIALSLDVILRQMG